MHVEGGHRMHLTRLGAIVFRHLWIYASCRRSTPIGIVAPLTVFGFRTGNLATIRRWFSSAFLRQSFSEICSARNIQNAGSNLYFSIIDFRIMDIIVNQKTRRLCLTSRTGLMGIKNNCGIRYHYRTTKLYHRRNITGCSNANNILFNRLSTSPLYQYIVIPDCELTHDAKTAPIGVKGGRCGGLWRPVI